MEVKFHRSFLKLYEKLPAKVQRRFEERLLVFQKDPFDESLHNHPLHGPWAGFRSINVTGDYRSIYESLDGKVATFYAIGTHSKLYDS